MSPAGDVIIVFGYLITTGLAVGVEEILAI
jgi:hypothetical protein